MAMKTIKVSFNIDMDMFARMCAAGGDMDIQIFGQDHEIKPSVTQTSEQKALPKPRSVMATIILAFVDGRTFSKADARTAIVKTGYANGTTGSALTMCVENGYLKKVAYNAYKVTKTGVHYAQAA